MFIEFEKLPSGSKVWVYQCDRMLDSDEAQKINSVCASFVNEWTAHQHNLLASCKIFYNHFIVFGVDENVNTASGCSIDNKMHFISELEKTFNLSLRERMQVAFRPAENKIEVCSMMEFAVMVRDHVIDEHTIVFNNLVNTKQELESKWEIPLSQSWHLQYLEAIRE